MLATQKPESVALYFISNIFFLATNISWYLSFHMEIHVMLSETVHCLTLLLCTPQIFYDCEVNVAQ